MWTHRASSPEKVTSELDLKGQVAAYKESQSLQAEKEEIAILGEGNYSKSYQCVRAY